MAHLVWSVESNIQGMQTLFKAFDHMSIKLMAKIGKMGRIALKRGFLSGQSIELKGGDAPLDAIGRRMISHKVLRAGKGVYWASYPVNLFERRHTLRSGKGAPGKYIITRKFKSLVDSKLQTWSDIAEKEIIAPEFNKV